MSPRSLFALAAAACLTLPGLAIATIDVPSPANSTTPTHLSLMGLDGGAAPDAHSEVLITIRGYAGEVLIGSTVMIDFSGCPDVALCIDSHDANAIVSCANRTIAKVTNVAGQARFRFAGGLRGPSSVVSCARIYADGVLLKSPSVAIYDLTGSDGVTPQDLSVWLEDFFSGSAPLHDDYNGDGSVGPADLSSWLDVFFANGSVSNCGAAGLCP